MLEKNQKKYGVLLGTLSIQKYIFSSNKLKDNLGASFLLSYIYDSILKDVLKRLNPSLSDDYLLKWETKPDNINISSNTFPCEIGYIGGGNALIFFNNPDDADNFIKEWTKRLLVDAPGVVTAVAFSEFDFNNFPKEMGKLFNLLKENSSKFSPITIIPAHGITAECPRSGYSLNVWLDNVATPEWVSSVTYAKIKAAKTAQDNLNETYSRILKDEFCFSSELEKLGQSKKEDNHIAIVHIDGNSMGARFRTTSTLADLRKLSISVKEATLEAFKDLISYIVNNFNEIDDEINPTIEDNKKVLPLLPIIIGGDDITFVSDGRLGIYFAKLFLEFFNGKHVSDEKPLSACAGIAITKTKYPFYRGYRLSEQLCRNAKKVRKENKNNGSWLDFHIAYGGFSGTLKDIRDNHYTVEGGSLLMRPYHLEQTPDDLSFNKLIQNTRDLIWKKKGERNFPNSKLLKLREVLSSGESLRKIFVYEMQAAVKKFPDNFQSNYSTNLFSNGVTPGVTPYFDMIEISESYPKFEIEIDR